MLKINEEFKNLIPPLTEDEYQQLKENLLVDGCREPLVIWRDYIVDGHNRYQICTENKIPFQTIKKDFPDREHVISWIILNQFGRRNLTKYQRSELVMKLKPVLQGKAKENQGNRNDLNILQNSVKSKSTDVQKELAKLAGVSHDTIYKSEKIMREGTQDQIERARKGGNGNSVSAIYGEVINKDIDTKVCKECGKELPISEFYTNRNACKECFNNARYKKDKPTPLSSEKPIETVVKRNDAVKDAYDTNRIIEHNISEVVLDLEANFQDSVGTIEKILELNSDIIMQPENNKEIRTFFTKAGIAIANLKGKYNYE